MDGLTHDEAVGVLRRQASQDTIALHVSRRKRRRPEGASFDEASVLPTTLEAPTTSSDAEADAVHTNVSNDLSTSTTVPADVAHELSTSVENHNINSSVDDPASHPNNSEAEETSSSITSGQGGASADLTAGFTVPSAIQLEADDLIGRHSRERRGKLCPAFINVARIAATCWAS